MKPYPTYKPSGIEWIGDIPEHWETKKIKQLTDGKPTDFIDGDWIESKDISESGIRYITTGNVGPGYYKEQGAGFISEETFHKLNCTELFPGDLLLSRLFVPVGRSCILPDIGYRIVTSVDNVIFHPKSDYNKRYLNYYFNWSRYNEYCDTLARGTTLNRISRSTLGNVFVILPPLPEQTAIAAYLDAKTEKIDRFIAHKQKLIELLKEERTAIINQAVTKGLNPNAPMKPSGIDWLGDIPAHWEVKRLKFIGDSFIGVTYSPEDVTEDITATLVMRSSNIQNGKIDLSDTVYINKAIPDRHRLKESDILICSRNGSAALIGKNVLIPKSLEGQTFGAFMTVFRSQFNFYMYWFYNSQFFKSQSGLFSTSTINQLTTEILNDMEVALPPEKTEMQNLSLFINHEVARIDSVVSKIESEITLMQEYRTALINEVVTGKINVTA